MTRDLLTTSIVLHTVGRRGLVQRELAIDKQRQSEGGKCKCKGKKKKRKTGARISLIAKVHSHLTTWVHGGVNLFLTPPPPSTIIKKDTHDKMIPSKHELSLLFTLSWLMNPSGSSSCRPATIFLFLRDDNSLCPSWIEPNLMGEHPMPMAMKLNQSRSHN
jgi:hypothetical protein